MRKTLIIASLGLAFIIAGCAEKTEVATNDATTQTTTDTDETANQTTTENNSTIGGNVGEQNQQHQGIEGNITNAINNNLDSVYFGFDRFNIEGQKNLAVIRANSRLITDSTYEVRVEGNTDEWGSDEYNYALALKRASSVQDALINNGVPRNKIKLVSYGESKPKCLEKTRECWKENRRVDFVLIPNQ